MDVSVHAKVGGVDDLVSAGHVQDGLGVDARLVGESAEAGDGVVEGDINLNGLGNKVLDLLELVQLVPRSDIVVAADNHAGKQATEGLDS